MDRYTYYMSRVKDGAYSKRQEYVKKIISLSKSIEGSKLKYIRHEGDGRFNTSSAFLDLVLYDKTGKELAAWMSYRLDNNLYSCRGLGEAS